MVKSDLSSNTLQTVASFTSQLPTSLGDSYQVVVNGSNVVTSELPYGVQYLGPDGSGNLQAFQIVLINTASLPTPNQHGLISSAPYASTTICSHSTGAQNTLQPTTGFAIVQYAVSPNTCGSGAATVLINASDSSTTAATAVPAGASGFADLYLSSGQLYGLVALDPSSSALKLYPATAAANSTGVPQFVSSTTLVTNVASFSKDNVTVNRSGQLGNSVAFLTVTFNGSPAPASQVIRLDTTGAATHVHTATGSLTTGLVAHSRDNANYYFIDAVTGSGSTTYNFFAAPIAGGNAVQIGSLNATSGTTSILDSDGTSLLVQSSSAGTSTIYAFAVAGPSNQTPTQIVQSTSLIATLDYASGQLYVIELGTGAPNSFVFKPSGSTPSTAIAGPLSGTELQAGLGAGYLNSGSVLEFSGVTAASNASGAEIRTFSTASLTASAGFTCALCGGGTYTLPSGATSGGLAEYSSTVAIGDLAVAAGSGNTIGLLANPQTLQLTPLAVTGSNVTPF